MNPRPMTVQSAGTPPGSLLHCAGEIDLGNVEELRRTLAHSIFMGLSEIDVDLVEVTFLDSSAIEALLMAQRELACRGGTLRVLGGECAAQLFRLLGLGSVLSFTEVVYEERSSGRGFTIDREPVLLDEITFPDDDTNGGADLSPDYRPDRRIAPHESDSPRPR